MGLKTGLLITSNIKGIRNVLKHIETDAINTLYVNILLETKLNILSSNIVKNKNRETFRNIMKHCYCEMITFENLDVRILLSNLRERDMFKIYTSKSIDTIYFDSLSPANLIETFVTAYVMNKSETYQLKPLSDIIEDNADILNNNDRINFVAHDYVAVGGTFDKLHYGHKILLSEAVLLCKKKLTVGVMSDSNIQYKMLPELIDSCATRKKVVTEFLNDVEPSLEYNIVTLFDNYGPTLTDESLQMIVVSKETRKGADIINDYRKTNGLNPLIIHSIDTIECLKQEENEESKLSSSNIRMRMLGFLMKDPMPQPTLSPTPYIIGLTGGIASGKSTVADYLKTLGCSCIDCDKICHEMYKTNNECRNFIVNTFGSDLLDQDNSINRKKLSTIVFKNEDMRNKLNNGMWPLILKNVKKEIAANKNREVVVIEATLLIQARWKNECHEIWSCIVPQEEAIKRLQERNNLSVEEARDRINSLPKNEFYVSHSNVIFCTYWDQIYTRQQVDKAWYHLKKRLSLHKL